MANRHSKKKAAGIAVSSSPAVDVIKEAEKKQDGGKVIGRMHGGLTRHRLDRPGRKMGGRVGADKSPLSSAKTATSPPGMPKSNSST